MDLKDTTTFIQKSEKLLKHVSNAGGLLTLFLFSSQFSSLPPSNKFIQLGQSTDDQDKLGNTFLTLVKNLEYSQRPMKTPKPRTAYKPNITDLINKSEETIQLVKNISLIWTPVLSVKTPFPHKPEPIIINPTLKQNAEDMCSKFKEEFDTASKNSLILIKDSTQ